MQIDEMDILVAQFWAAFGVGAGMSFENECVNKAVELNYYAIVRRNAEKFKTEPGAFRQARNCCVRAGKYAAFLAREDPDSEIITVEQFEAACRKVEERVERVRQRTLQNSTIPLNMAFAGVCG